MAHKRSYPSAMSSLFLDLEAVRRNTNSIWSEALSAKEQTLIEHEKLKSDPRLSPILFTQQPHYQRGREEIVFGDKKAAASREEADLQFYHTLMSNKYARGSDSARTKPHMFLTCDQLANTNVRRILTKYSREFGGTPIEHGSKSILKRKTSNFPELQASVSHPELNWRHEVNEYVLGRVGKIYSPQFQKRQELKSTITSFLSVPASPDSHNSGRIRRKRLTFGLLIGQKGVKSPDNKEPEGINIQAEIKRTRTKLAEQRFQMGYKRARNLDRLKLQPNYRHVTK